MAITTVYHPTRDVSVLLKPQRFENQIDAVSQLFHFLYTT